MHFSKVPFGSVSLGVFITVVLLAGMFTACRQNNTPDTSTSTLPKVTALDSPEQVASALKQEGATLNLYWPSGGMIKAWIVDKLVPGYQAYVKEQYGVDVTVNILATEGGDQAFFQKIQGYEQANSHRNNFDIDVVRVVPNIELLKAGEKGWFLCVLPDYAQLLPNLTKVNQPGLQSFTTNGKTYAIPVYQPTISFFYNKERLPNPPQSALELLSWAKANPGRFTYEDPRGSISSGSMFMLTVMKTFGNPNNPNTYSQGLKFLKELQKYVYPEPTDSSQMIDLIKQGNVWLIAFWNDFGLSVVRNQKLSFMANYFPKEGTPVRNTPIAIPKSATHKIAGLLFLNYALSDKVQRELAQFTQQIPASISSGVWKDLPIDIFNYDFAYIQSHTFTAFHSQQNLDSIKTMVDKFPTLIATVSTPFSLNFSASLSTSKRLSQIPSASKTKAKRLMDLGDEQYQNGQFKAALNSFQQSLKSYWELGDRVGEAASLNFIGLDYYMLGHSTETLQFWQQSSAVYREIGDRAAERHMLFKIAALADNIGQYSQALEFFKKVLAIDREIGNRFKEEATLREIRAVSSRLGQYPQPLEFYEAIGDALLRSGNLVEASKTLLAGIKDLESVRQGLSDTDKISIFEAQAAAYRILQKVLIAQGKLAAALEISERGRVRAFAELLASRLSSKPTAQIPPPTVREIQRIAKEQNATLVEYSIIYNRHQVRAQPQSQESELFIWVLKPTGEITFRRVDLKPLWQQNISLTELAPNPNTLPNAPNSPSVVTNTPESGQELKIPWSHAKEVALFMLATGSVIGIIVCYGRGFLTASKLKHGWLMPSLLLVLAVGSGGGLFFWMTRYQVITGNSIPRDGSMLTNLVFNTRKSFGEKDTFLKNMLRGLGLVPKDQQLSQTNQLQQLHQILIQPIADLLPKDPNARVIFIPQSSLFLVPFPALQDVDGKYLIEKHTILTAPSIQVLDLTRQQKQRLGTINKLPLQGKDALIVGNPTMPSVPPQIGEPPQQLPSLPGAEEEAKTIAALLKTQAITGNQASKSTILQKVPSSRIIHLATHGILDDIRGLGSAIALAPSGKDNGLLTAEQILDLKLNAELVVLSACNTGRGKITGDGVIGLSRSLISAGVPSVIVSLWSVPDAPTASLMSEFYRHLQQNPDKAQALRQAMLTTMRQHPYPRDWAAFTLIGEAE